MLRLLGLLGVFAGLLAPAVAGAQPRGPRPVAPRGGAPAPRRPIPRTPQLPPPDDTGDEPMDEPPQPPSVQVVLPNLPNLGGNPDFPGAMQTLRAPSGTQAPGANRGPEIFPDAGRVWMSVRDTDPVPIETARRGGPWVCGGGQCTTSNQDPGQSAIGDAMLRSIKLQTPTLPLPLTIWRRLNERSGILDFDPVLMDRRDYGHVCAYRPIEQADPKAAASSGPKKVEKAPPCFDGEPKPVTPNSAEITLGLEWPKQLDLANFRYLAIVDSCGNARVQPFQRTFTVPVYEVATGGCKQADGAVLRVFPQGGWIRVTAFSLDAPATANVVNATYRVTIPALESGVESNPARLLFPDPLYDDLKVDCGPRHQAAPPGSFLTPPPGAHPPGMVGPGPAPPGAKAPGPAPPGAAPPGPAPPDKPDALKGIENEEDFAGKGGPPAPKPGGPAPPVAPAAPDARPTGDKPMDAKPGDAKPADAKPADAKPADAKPADPKAAPPGAKPPGPLAPKQPEPPAPGRTFAPPPSGPGAQPMANESLVIAPEPLRQGLCRIRLTGQTKNRLVAPLALFVSFTRTDVQQQRNTPNELLVDNKWIVTPNDAEFQLPALGDSVDGDSRLRLAVSSDPLSANGKVVLLSDAGRVAASLRNPDGGDEERARRVIGTVVIHSVPLCGAWNFETVETVGNCVRAYMTIPTMIATLQVTRAPWVEKPLITRSLLTAVGVALAIDSYNPVERKAFPIAGQIGGMIENLGDGRLGMLGYVGIAPTIPVLGSGGNTTSLGFLGGVGVEYITNEVGPDEGLKPAAFLGLVVQVGQANPLSASGKGSIGISGSASASVQ